MSEQIIKNVGSPDAERLWELREKALSAGGFMKKVYARRYNKKVRQEGAFIPLRTEFRGKPVFPHGISGVFVSNGAKIGKNCVIFHQVTIGSNNLEGTKRRGAPEVGDDVYIGCGAKIIGAVKIGNNVRIGANCTVTSDVPDNSTVVSAPVRVITKDEPQDNSFIKW